MALENPNRDERKYYQVDLSWAAAMERPSVDLASAGARAVELGNRLLDIEDATLALRAEIGRLRRELDQSGGGSGSGGWFDVPRAKYPWRLAEEAGGDLSSLDSYDRRVDDGVVLEGRLGELFNERFGMATATPDFAGAVDAINVAVPQLRVVTAEMDETPDVSIIIPIYGQLGYTLSCIESLIRQRSRYSVEIIIIDDCSPDRSGEFLSALAMARYHLQPVNGGFIQSCNFGGDLARGVYVLMLNNDTRVVAGWLDALIDSFAIFPNAGVVGSKMFYADGSLQEAGGIIWRDGSCWNYGRGDDPNRPQYCHARQVDYISGCSIALPTALWRQLKGFDQHYKPAYCEDADLCLRVAASGREVWFQPQSRVVHYEGKTSGTDTTRSIKAYQVINTKKLYLRWRERLERHRRNAEAPYFERERTVQRRMLFVDASVPTPNQDAGSMQITFSIQVARELGYKTHFVAADNWLFQPEYTTALMMGGVECAYAPYDVGFGTYIRRYGHLFDVVIVYRVGVLEGIIQDIRAHAPNAALLFNLSDLHFLRMQREAAIEGNAEGLREAEILKKRELALIAASDRTITHSSVEAEVIDAELPEARVTVWPLMYEVHGTNVPFSQRTGVSFLGGYRHSPNIDAVNYFVTEIFPLIRAQDPTIRFIIAGSNMTRELKDLACKDIEVVGLVDDLRDLFDRTRVFVSPLRFGAGAKGKIMSALSYGTPIVSSSVGIEGAGIGGDVDVLVADEPMEFALKTVQLYNDEELWGKLSRGGQDLVKRKFSIESGHNILQELVNNGHANRIGMRE
jgi:GT2 family glycosyltransferase